MEASRQEEPIRPEKGMPFTVSEDNKFFAGRTGTIELYRPNDQGWRDTLVNLESEARKYQAWLYASDLILGTNLRLVEE